MARISKLIYINLFTLALFAVFLFLLKKSSLVPGFCLGYMTGFLNFVLLHVSIRDVFDANGTSSSDIFKKTFLYIIRFFLKMLFLALLLILFVKFLNINWFGLLIGLIASTFVYMMNILRKDLWQFSRKQ
ncbi:MAG: ATP synthase subunit I [Elusimicrobia bacterium]|nr:ATP synthase subunit I [Candidatus Liberimonas magnetica]